MSNLLTNLVASFGAGLFAPLGAVCVLPLYPGFLAYLANQTKGKEQKSIIGILGATVTAGVVTSMVLVGFIFTWLLQESLTNAIGVISPIAFGILVLVSILLIFNVDMGRFLPRSKTPTGKNPYITSFLLGFFFGAIILPCNPASLIILFALSTSVTGFLASFLGFVVFGIGMAFPLLLFAVISSSKSNNIIGFLTKHKRIINFIAGVIMLVISLYYLIFVFHVFGISQKNIPDDKMVASEVFENDEEMKHEEMKTNEKEENINKYDIKTTLGGVKYIVDPEKILSGGPPKDGIPSIDNPKFVSVKEADKFIQDNELVLAMIYKGTKRVYPLQIMVWHEIVNDKIAGDPILVTYCPLCGSGIAYERKINGQEVEFGTSGKLYNSNLVMYDRKTDSYWSQIDGLAIVGELTGTELEAISVDTVVWRDWKKLHSDSRVLSQDTGFGRSYGTDPYGNYYEDSFLIFPVENEDDRVHPKTVVFGIEVDGMFKAYKEDDLIKVGTINDEVGGAKIEIARDDAGIVKITNLNTGKEIVKERDFWFAWYAFHPETHLYTQD